MSSGARSDYPEPELPGSVFRRLPDSLHGHLRRVCYCSPFCRDLIARRPDDLYYLADQGRLQTDCPPERRGLELLQDENPVFDHALRHFRNREMLRIVWRDLNRLSTLDSTLTDLSGLAGICLEACIRHHGASLEARHGIPQNGAGEPQGLVVLGMGKLGGGELNLSSDIDVIFAYPENGDTTGPRKFSNEQYFTRLVRAVIASLGEVSEHGFVFRVDTRLRPYGQAGPLVSSFSALEQYYQREGRDWERYALIKARPVAGDREAGETLLEMLQPFIYRRYVDFGAIEALREMAARIDREALHRGFENDIKRGPGGIREAEFFVQSFQILRGGRDTGLQTPEFLRALTVISDLGLAPQKDLAELESAYRYLRTLENRIQALRDRQTHHLPSDPDDQRRLCAAMDCGDWAELLDRLKLHRREIRQLFNGICGPASDPETAPAEGRRFWSLLMDQDQPLEPVAEAICPDGEKILEPLRDLRRFLCRTAISQRAQQRLNQLMPKLLHELQTAPLEAAPLSRVLDLIRAISRRSAYVALLGENPGAFRRMLSLFSQSPWLADKVIRYPVLLDELIDPVLGIDLPDRDRLQDILSNAVRPNLETEQQLGALNEFKLGYELRTAIAFLEEKADLRTCQALLSGLAEVLIDRIDKLARDAMEIRSGKAPNLAFSVIAYGTLGAFELGYQSDLDLVFLYETEDGAGIGGGGFNAERYAARLSQRLLSLLSTLTQAGLLYSVDTRLRPNGRAGSLVSSIQAFEEYQLGHAWTWERQALTRARWIAGSRSLRTKFADIRARVLAASPEPGALRGDVVAMRERIRKTRQSDTAGAEAIKHVSGGLVDVEFIAQYGVLRHAANQPRLMDPTSTVDQLGLLTEIGFLSDGEGAALTSAWLGYNRARHLDFLRYAGGEEPFTAEREAVRACWQRLFGND